jgi:FkbM family methyltransferase
MTSSAATVAALAADPAMASLRRSLQAYYGDPTRSATMDAFYARFVRPGSLTFDLGAHVGDRVGSFLRLGARVVAVEPQPLCVQALRALYGDDERVTIVAAACGESEGRVALHVNSANPTVSSASEGFITAADGAPLWEGQEWDARIEVPSTTLDSLIAGHGLPAFTKIDVEGYESAVLAGLSQPLPALSFEFTTIAREAAVECVERLTSLHPYRFDVSVGESWRLAFRRWVTGAELAAYLRALPHAVNFGDVYCLRRPGARPGTP